MGDKGSATEARSRPSPLQRRQCRPAGRPGDAQARPVARAHSAGIDERPVPDPPNDHLKDHQPDARRQPPHRQRGRSFRHGSRVRYPPGRFPLPPRAGTPHINTRGSWSPGPACATVSPATATPPPTPNSCPHAPSRPTPPSERSRSGSARSWRHTTSAYNTLKDALQAMSSGHDLAPLLVTGADSPAW
jgi:hypothetical protein